MIIGYKMLFPVPFLKHSAASIGKLQDPAAARLRFVVVAALGVEGCHSLNDRTVNFRCGHPKLQIRPTILVSLEYAGSHQCNSTSPVCIHCMVL